MDNQQTLITGYRELNPAEIDAVNLIKGAEIDLGHLWRDFFESGTVDVDRRWMAVAKTHFEEGFSAFVRAIAQPVPRF